MQGWAYVTAAHPAAACTHCPHPPSGDGFGGRHVRHRSHTTFHNTKYTHTGSALLEQSTCLAAKVRAEGPLTTNRTRSSRLTPNKTICPRKVIQLTADTHCLRNMRPIPGNRTVSQQRKQRRPSRLLFFLLSVHAKFVYTSKFCSCHGLSALFWPKDRARQA